MAKGDPWRGFWAPWADFGVKKGRGAFHKVVPPSPLLGLLPPRNPCGCFPGYTPANSTSFPEPVLARTGKLWSTRSMHFIISLGFPFAKGAAGNSFEEEFGYEFCRICLGFPLRKALQGTTLKNTSGTKFKEIAWVSLCFAKGVAGNNFEETNGCIF